MEDIKKDQNSLEFICMFLSFAIQILVWGNTGDSIMWLFAVTLLVVMFRISLIYDDLQCRHDLMQFERYRKW